MLNHLIYRLKRPYHLVKTGLFKGLVSQWQYGSPAKKLKIIAITGTDGKTTSSSILYHIMKKADKKVALLSTVAAYIGDKEIDTGFHVTSPSPRDLNEFMKEMVDQGIEYLVMEVTSHGLYQYRTWGIKPLIAGLTNISNEHLDYHGTYQEYLKAKAMLFKKAKLAVINDDDQSAPALKKILREKRIPLETYSHDEKLEPVIERAIKKRFVEKYNQANAKLAATMASFMEITPKKVAAAIEKFPGVTGRMEEVISSPYKVIVDFAHTPQALEAALTTLREQLNKQRTKGRLIAIYGSAGLRDRTKRPAMGRVGSELADLVVLTAEDPRTENVWTIIRQMKEQLTENHNKILSIGDRGEAISFTLNKLAKKGDIIGIFGKGHEQSMCYGTVEYPWDDRVAAKNAFKNKG